MPDIFRLKNWSCWLVLLSIVAFPSLNNDGPWICLVPARMSTRHATSLVTLLRKLCTASPLSVVLLSPFDPWLRKTELSTGSPQSFDVISLLGENFWKNFRKSLC